MKVLLEPSFTELVDSDLYKKIELCGRICYKSEDKITEQSAKAFVQRICVNQHGSVLEHFSFLFELDLKYYEELKNLNIPFFTFSNLHRPLVSFNLRAILQTQHKIESLHPFIHVLHQKYPDIFTQDFDTNIEVKEIEACTLSYEEKLLHQRVTIRLITDRGVTHELVRHRLASFSQESTRYCNYSKDKFGNEITVLCPQGLTESTRPIWEKAMEEVEKRYFEMINNGATPQIARSVLPNSLKTEICITASIEEWKLIFDLRCDEKAHPDCRKAMIPVREYFYAKGYLVK